MAERYAAGSKEARIVEAQKYVYCHTRSATRLGNRHIAFGAVVVLLAALEGAFVVGGTQGTLDTIRDGSNSAAFWPSVLAVMVPVLAVTVPVLVALQSFLNLKGRSETHKRFAADWHRLLEKVELQWDDADEAKIAEFNESAYQLRAAHPVFRQKLWDAATAHWGHVIQRIK